MTLKQISFETFFQRRFNVSLLFFNVVPMLKQRRCACWDSPKTKFNKHNTIRSRSMKNYSTLNEKLSEINWFKVINCNDVDVAWSNFKDLFMSVHG